MTDPWIDRLSEYVDEDLAPRDRAALEAHLRSCAECGRVLEDLRAVVSQAKSVGDRAPEDDLWPGIAARLDAPGTIAFPFGQARSGGGGRRFAFTFPQLAAAGFTLALLSAGAMWFAMHRAAVPPDRAPAPIAVRPTPDSGRSATGRSATGRSDIGRAPAREPAPVTNFTLAGFDEERYADAVAELERVLHDHRADLDTSTVRILEQNLAIIDRATEQARRALLADPSNPYLNGHLAEQMKKKIQLLQIATEFVAVHQS